MKKLASTAIIYIVLSLLFVIGNFTVVMASPARIEEPSFETVANWAFSQNDTDYTGATSEVWKTQGLKSYLFSVSNATITAQAYCQILQSSVDFAPIDRISFDANLHASVAKFTAEAIVGADTAWTKAVPTTATPYLHEEVDLSSYDTSQNLIFKITATGGQAPNCSLTCYFDNIKIWGSHSDATWTVVCNSFADSTNHAYMYGENFNAGSTKVGWYDGGGAWRQTDEYISWGGGVLNWSECLFSGFEGTAAAAGDWHAVVLLQADDPPATYAAAIADPQFIADDVFNVAGTAIPEFPAVIAAIVVAGLCFGIYYWMRKRAHGVHGFAYHKIAKAEQKVE